jgi:hypothetical protein
MWMYSCTPAYIPNVVNTPLLTEQGDAKINANLGVSGQDFQGAYAVNDHFGLILNTSFYNSDDIDSGGYYNQHNFVELGAGYFTPISKSGTVAFYGGAGFGKIHSNYSSNVSAFNNDLQTRMLRLFIQPTIGIHTNVFEGALAGRVVLLNLMDLPQTSMDAFFEPTVTYKLGFKYFKLTMQTGLSVPITNTNLQYDYHPFMFSMGMELNLGAILKDMK